jgi:hypothetical protein
MDKRYDTPIVEIETINADVITNSEWELPKTEWDDEEGRDW